MVKRRELSVTASHPSLGKLGPGDTIEHEYGDHLLPTPGAAGTVLLRNEAAQPVMVVGRVGRGRVVYTGQIFGLTRDNQRRESVGAEWTLLYHLVRWAGTRD